MVVHRVDGVVLVQRQVNRVAVAVGKDDAVGGFAGGEDDFFDAELGGSIQRVDAELAQ